MTDYIILAKTDGKWAEAGRLPARSGESAIREYITSRQAESEQAMTVDSEYQAMSVDSAYVAVPSRSFRPVTVKIETKTALKFS